MNKIAVLPGDGIGPEVMEVTLEVLDKVQEAFGLQLETTTADVGGVAIDSTVDAVDNAHRISISWHRMVSASLSSTIPLAVARPVPV